MKNGTMKDVARTAGVSVSTVSNVLNGLGSSFKTRERVLNAAAKLHYSPNVFARNMRAHRTKCLGIVVERRMDEENPWMQQLVMMLIGQISGPGCDYQVLVEFWDASSETMPRLLNSVDGIVHLGHFPDSFFAQLDQVFGKPCITYVERSSSRHGLSLFRGTEGMQRALEHLLALGHERVAFVISDLDCETQMRRLDEYRQSFAFYRRDVPEDLLVTLPEMSSQHSAAAFERTAELLEQHDDVTAIIFASDVLALGGVEAIRDSERRIPDDISIVSFDDTTWAKCHFPPITSVGFDVRILAQRLHNNLISMIERGCPVDAEVPLAHELYVRGSTAAPRT